MSDDPKSSGDGWKVLKVVLGVFAVIVGLVLLAVGICAYALTKS